MLIECSINLEILKVPCLIKGINLSIFPVKVIDKGLRNWQNLGRCTGLNAQFGSLYEQAFAVPMMICDMIKGNESDVANIDFEL